MFMRSLASWVRIEFGYSGTTKYMNISDDGLQPQSSLRLDIEGERLTLIQGLVSWNWPCIRSEREYILAALVALAA